MIRPYTEADLYHVMQLWLTTNIDAHPFIAPSYWHNMYPLVKKMIPVAELYVYENDETAKIDGFIGLSEEHIEGIFVDEASQSKTIGTQLLHHVKGRKRRLTLEVYQKNTRAIAFYKKEDFSIQDETLDRETGEKAYYMSWNKPFTY